MSLTLIGILLIMPGAMLAVFLGLMAYIRRMERIEQDIRETEEHSIYSGRLR